MTVETRVQVLPRPVAPLLPSKVETPALVIDLDIVERNAARMAQAMAERGVALRPHIKTHKTVALARIQLEHGASGITVGTLGEAEVMASAGINDIFVAYPVWAAGDKARRLRALAERDDLSFSVAIDSPEGARMVAAAMAGSADTLRVLIDVDPHYGRTGVAADRAGQLGRSAQQLGLEVVGAYTHGGHSYLAADAGEQAAADEVEVLTSAAQALREVSIEPHVLSAGSSPTAIAAAQPPVTEMRPGTYLIGDRLQVAVGASPADGVAIAIAATVVSTAVPGQVVIDAGAKALTKDVPSYLNGYGTIPAYPEGVIERVSDYHGQVRFPDGAPRPRLGEVVAVVPNHACPVIDLYDTFLATRSGVVVGRWRVDARGMSG
jgi:D-serine deaminase-like pyridoxal phosphate-dependent protein